LAALNRQKADRLPVTTHHVMPSFLETDMKGLNEQDFFDADPVLLQAYADEARQCTYDLS